MRIALTPEDQRDAAQREVAQIMTSGPRGGIVGPFPALLEHPDICRPIQDLGRALRFEGVLPGRLRELAILVTARHCTAQFEWFAHAAIAAAEGLAAPVIEAIRLGQRPAGMASDETLVYEAALALHGGYAIPDDLGERLQAALGLKALLEVTALCGYYTLVSMVLNLAEVPVPGGARPLAPIA